MTVPVGKLRGQNFRAVEIDEKKMVSAKLEETDNFDLSDCLAAKVELEEPIHQILNLPEFDEPAVSFAYLFKNLSTNAFPIAAKPTNSPKFRCFIQASMVNSATV